jgi:FtsH-binding integral membrane protein
LGFSNEAGILEKSAIWPKYVRERISSTFQYLGGGIGFTAAAAYAVTRSPALMNLAMRNSMMAMIGSMVLIVGSGMIVRSMPYEQGGPLGAKHLAWAAHAALLGGMIAPLSLYGGPLLMTAAMYTAVSVVKFKIIRFCKV